MHNCDLLVEGQALHDEDIEVPPNTAADRHVGDNLRVGVEYYTRSLSDDLRVVRYEDKGVFINFVAKLKILREKVDMSY